MCAESAITVTIERQEATMNGTGNVTNQASFGGAQEAPPAGQTPKPDSGQLRGIPVKSAQETGESPLSWRREPYPERATPSLGTPAPAERAAQPGAAPAAAPPTNVRVVGTAA